MIKMRNKGMLLPTFMIASKRRGKEKKRCSGNTAPDKIPHHDATCLWTISNFRFFFRYDNGITRPFFPRCDKTLQHNSLQACSIHFRGTIPICESLLSGVVGSHAGIVAGAVIGKQGGPRLYKGQRSSLLFQCHSRRL